MCGIALIYNTHQQAPEKQRIERMTRSLRHRGPDAQASVVRGPVALGHTRLSIVDVAGGGQPMLSDDGRFAIVFNGEIYNYRALRERLEGQGIPFRSQSDTEVVLQLYRRDGADCVQQLRGMFSFAIHDQTDNTLFIARDRLGIKPLVYHWNGQVLLAASEIKALFASGLLEPQFNPASIRNYFIYQFAINPHTPFVGVMELPAGHHLTLKPGRSLEISQYWDLNFPRENEYESLDEDYWTAQFRAALEDAADSHTIGEVPIGAYLSGGVDSATTTWLLTECYKNPVNTFSVKFQDGELDESPIYRNIAQHLGVANHELVMHNPDPTQGYLPELAAALEFLEQPQRMALDVPLFMLSRLVRDQGYKVIYSGEGADEILAGYDCYRQDYMRLWGNDIRDPELRSLLYTSMYTQNFADPQVQLLMALHDRQRQQTVTDRFGCYPVWYDFWQFTDELLPGLFNADFEAAALAEDQMGALAAQMRPQIEGRHRINQSLYIETKTRLPGWILWRGDRMSMAHGVEARVPFMDHPMAELAARLPPSLKLNGMNEKYLLKKVATPHLPEHPWQYKKKAFYTPIRDWFFLPQHAEALEPYLGQSALRETGIFNPNTVGALLSRLLASSAPRNMNAYFRVMQLEWILMLVLSVQMLHSRFQGKQADCFKASK